MDPFILIPMTSFLLPLIGVCLVYAKFSLKAAAMTSLVFCILAVLASVYLVWEGIIVDSTQVVSGAYALVPIVLILAPVFFGALLGLCFSALQNRKHHLT